MILIGMLAIAMTVAIFLMALLSGVLWSRQKDERSGRRPRPTR